MEEKEFNPYEMIGKIIELRETPGFIWENNEAGEEDTPTILNGRYEVIEWDAGNYEFGLVTEEEAKINRTIPDDQPFSPTIYWVNSEYVDVPEEIVNEVDQLDAAFNAPAVEHPLGPHTGSGNEYYTISPLDETSMRAAPVLLEWAVSQSLLPEGFYSKGVISQDESGSYVIKLTGEEYQLLITACRVFMQYTTNDALFPKLAESLSKVSVLSGIFTDLRNRGDIETMHSFIIQVVNDITNFIEKIIQTQPDPSSEAGLEDAFNAPDADHPLGPHTGYKLDPTLQTVLEEQMIEGGVPESEVDPSIKDIEEAMSKRLKNKKSKHVTSMEALPMPEPGEEAAGYADLNPYTNTDEDNHFGTGFDEQMQRIYEALVNTGLSPEEAMAKVEALIKDLEQDASAPPTPPEDPNNNNPFNNPFDESRYTNVSLDRQTMPAEHLGWYQSDFHEKGNEDLELPNVKEEIVMPDEPTGLEKD